MWVCCFCLGDYGFMVGTVGLVFMFGLFVVGFVAYIVGLGVC